MAFRHSFLFNARDQNVRKIETSGRMAVSRPYEEADGLSARAPVGRLGHRVPRAPP
ncbi:hypothetical protein CHELA1G11_10903 [Hyphomicrobiales bacterium]|nr:hypothetical protein CHELA1G11_10903 [Hyphomicrobiales bacterium]CAH1671512.1 hypothetical protein CHELA1G2_13407 [Hyphomicrobiales bacterium]